MNGKFQRSQKNCLIEKKTAAPKNFRAAVRDLDLNVRPDCNQN